MGEASKAAYMIKVKLRRYDGNKCGDDRERERELMLLLLLFLFFSRQFSVAGAASQLSQAVIQGVREQHNTIAWSFC